MVRQKRHICFDFRSIVRKSGEEDAALILERQTLTTSDKRKQSAAFSASTPTPCYTSLTMADDLQNYKLQLQQVRE